MIWFIIGIFAGMALFDFIQRHDDTVTWYNWPVVLYQIVRTWGATG